jgi:hypothetical protein
LVQWDNRSLAVAALFRNLCPTVVDSFAGPTAYFVRGSVSAVVV